MASRQVVLAANKCQFNLMKALAIDNSIFLVDLTREEKPLEIDFGIW